MKNFFLTFGCALSLLTASCTSRSTPQAMQDIRPEGARLSRTEVIRIAKEAAVQKGINFRDYYEPETHYEFVR